jgi:hypothetical protein
MRDSDETTTKKKNWSTISPIWGDPTLQILMNLGTLGDLADVIKCTSFGFY